MYRLLSSFVQGVLSRGIFTDSCGAVQEEGCERAEVEELRGIELPRKPNIPIEGIFIP